jgi:DNA repair protein RadC
MPQVSNNRELRLREQLTTLGPHTLTDQELLAAFISSGSAGLSCLDLAKALLDHFGIMPLHFKTIKFSI